MTPPLAILWKRDYNSLHNTTGGAVMDNDKYPYYEWLEAVMENLAKNEVKAISLEVVYEDGTVSTQYWNVNRGDRALMMAAMEEAQIMDTIADNRDVLMAILEGEDEEDDDDTSSDFLPTLPDSSAPSGH
jgi:hypothetical protein